MTRKTAEPYDPFQRERERQAQGARHMAEFRQRLQELELEPAEGPPPEPTDRSGAVDYRKLYAKFGDAPAGPDALAKPERNPAEVRREAAARTVWKQVVELLERTPPTAAALAEAGAGLDGVHAALEQLRQDALAAARSAFAAAPAAAELADAKTALATAETVVQATTTEQTAAANEMRAALAEGRPSVDAATRMAGLEGAVRTAGLEGAVRSGQDALPGPVACRSRPVPRLPASRADWGPGRGKRPGGSWPPCPRAGRNRDPGPVSFAPPVWQLGTGGPVLNAPPRRRPLPR
jgi:hypothetical protein